MTHTAAAVGVALCASAWMVAPAPVVAAIAGVVRIDTGQVTGGPTRDPAVTVFRSLPYAAPPVGELRWRPPAPPAAWDGVRKADQPGPICPQTGSGNGRTLSEDCLNLDVWTAAGSAGERRPVMVWFHGGGDGFGAGNSPQFDGEGLARKGAVLVTVNYRGGPFSQLSTPELSSESGHNASGDYGLMDAAAALQWVRRNIAAFGGNPGNVTIFGQSFGAGLEQFLSASPLAKGLFHKMILQSHARYERDPEPHTSGYRTLKKAEADGVAFAKDLGVSTLEEMRALPWEKVIATYRAEEAARSERGVFWTFILDGYVMPRTFAEIYAAGAAADVAVISGDNRDETGSSPDTAYDLIVSGTAARGNFPAPAKVADYLAASRRKMGAMSDEFLKLYPAGNDREAFLSASAAARDGSHVSTWLWATSWRRKETKPVYLYVWTHAPPGPNHDLAGASHGSEIAYVFDHVDPAPAAWSDGDRRIADTMSSYWINFASTGDPNGPGLPRWPAFDARTAQVMELGENFRPMPVTEKERMDFWKRFYASQPAN